MKFRNTDNKKFRNTIDNKTISKMIEKINETRKDNIERGFPLCSKNNKIISGEQCKGDKCEIERLSECKEGKNIGSFHTHPLFGGVDMSSPDSFNACKSEIFCIGTKLNDEVTINCWSRKLEKNKNECMRHAHSNIQIEEKMKMFSVRKDYESYRNYAKMLEISRKKLETEYFDKSKLL